jgi:uncharacterized paraquat-inducible protein A
VLLATTGVLSAAALVVPAAAFLVPVTRFLGFAWLIGTCAAVGLVRRGAAGS